MAWEGERTITFTMEDALISPAGFMILSGAGLIEADEDNKIYVHTTEQTEKVTVKDGVVTITLSDLPHCLIAKDPQGNEIVDANGNYTISAGEDFIYVMLLKNGEVTTEPYIPTTLNKSTNVITLSADDDLSPFTGGEDLVVLVDYYVEKTSGAQQIEITPDKFGGNYYLEASTLFRDQNGVDMPAEFIIPNCKIQSNFTFTMASSGDPSTFTFTMDAFPDYTRFDKTKKVLAAIQIVDSLGTSEDNKKRTETYAGYSKA
jgi:hypothetical protein